MTDPIDDITVSIENVKVRRSIECAWCGTTESTVIPASSATAPEVADAARLSILSWAKEGWTVRAGHVCCPVCSAEGDAT